MIAVCLLTCDRPALTKLCVSSFVQHHGQRTDLLLLHCDGGSETDENVSLALSHGFLTLCAPSREERIGQMATLRIFLDEVKDAHCPWMLWLENDWETVAQIPTEDFLEQADTVRLFGVRKMRYGHRQLAGSRRMGTEDPIVWTEHAVGWESGRAHWAAGGSLIRTEILERNRSVRRLKDVIEVENNLWSLRPVENLMWCHGVETTAGVMG